MTCEKTEYVQEYPWCFVIGTSGGDINRQFGLNELEYLPSTVQYKEKQYILGGISLHITNHFISILPTDGGYVLYDGLQSNHPIDSLPEILKLAAKQKPLIGKIVYFLNPKQKKKKTT
uniref:Uncharacterized protein n=1 Tax=Panagrolaimus sp. PS1159 TaxID=55785 RepID=A0AC35F7Y7_9BILA